MRDKYTKKKKKDEKFSLTRNRVTKKARHKEPGNIIKSILHTYDVLICIILRNRLQRSAENDKRFIKAIFRVY